MQEFSERAYAYAMMSSPATPLDVRPATGLLKALADDNRLRILALLARGELCVCHVAAALDLSQPNVSQHLTVLRNAGVVESERRGSWIHYRITPALDPVRGRILQAVLDGVAELAEGRGDAERLEMSKATTTCR